MKASVPSESDRSYDAVLVGAGIMSATLAMLLHEIEPELRVLILERLELPALESTAAINNAGTGHAANCELNYTPLQSDGTVQVSKALKINFAFEQSLEFWASLASCGKIDPSKFLNQLPHISFVSGESDSLYLKQRFSQLSQYLPFSEMEWSSDSQELMNWMPLVFEGRSRDISVAGTRVKRGFDVDFGALTSSYLDYLKGNTSIDIKYSSEVIDLRRACNEGWEIDVKSDLGSFQVKTPFVFVGAGGGALSLLQKSKIPQGLYYGGFPVSGQWLICNNESLVSKHNSKVYGKAKLGAPPMSVPHLDSRWISGKPSLLFGPFAGFTTKFLKEGSGMDFFRSIGLNNFSPIVQVGIKNLDLVKYLIGQLAMNEDDRLNELRQFLPQADKSNWRLAVAGQRVQIIKRSNQGGLLQMGTEVVSASDGSFAALLGASPGASTAVTIMLEVLERSWGRKLDEPKYQNKLKKIFPSFGRDFNCNATFYQDMRSRNDSLLNCA